MISKLTQALILSGCLVAAGAASADQRDVIVPVIAGAAVGAVLATVITGSGHDNHHYRQEYRGYGPQYQPVAYVPVQPRYEYRRYAPPPPPRYYGGGHDRGYDRGYDRGFDHGRGDGRW